MMLNLVELASGHAWFRTAVKISTKRIFHNYGRFGIILTKQNEPKQIVYMYILYTNTRVSVYLCIYISRHIKKN